MSKKSTSKGFSILVTELLQLGQVLLLKLGPFVEEKQAFCGQSENKWKVTGSVTTSVTQQQVVATDAKACLSSSLDELFDSLWVMPAMSNFSLNSWSLAESEQQKVGSLQGKGWITLILSTANSSFLVSHWQGFTSGLSYTYFKMRDSSQSLVICLDQLNWCSYTEISWTMFLHYKKYFPSLTCIFMLLAMKRHRQAQST